jgi:hypothetical protein
VGHHAAVRATVAVAVLLLDTTMTHTHHRSTRGTAPSASVCCHQPVKKTAAVSVTARSRRDVGATCVWPVDPLLAPGIENDGH